jgi:hypothetical protein
VDPTPHATQPCGKIGRARSLEEVLVEVHGRRPRCCHGAGGELGSDEEQEDGNEKVQGRELGRDDRQGQGRRLDG